ncbi:MAG: polysaccharide deacetylase family protein [Gammaproteobacteria bacterium]|nr:polysaccharide deacetylase family protein [Gammaproteobacteria bacterium]MBU1968394.1 polysaccharide deacetylase family protein [Gammaproteobacteria bacterium]
MHFPCRNWKPTISIKLSLVLLAACIMVTLWNPSLWPWTAGIVFANHLILTVAGLIPRSTLLGPNITRLPADAAQRGKVAITIDDGPDPEVTPKVLDILDRYQARATFFCIGRLAAQYPDLCREIVRRGHQVENHSMSHNWYFSLLDPWSIHREVRDAQGTLSAITGQVPRFFRATAGLRNPELEPVLAHCGLQLCSWSKRGFDTQVRDTDAVFNSLTQDLRGGDILLLHDGSAARTAAGQPVILDVLPRLLDKLSQINLRSVTLSDAIP